MRTRERLARLFAISILASLLSALPAQAAIPASRARCHGHGPHGMRFGPGCSTLEAGGSGPAGPQVSAGALAGPTDCAVPGLDDRCEGWFLRGMGGDGLAASPDGTTVYLSTGSVIRAIDVTTGSTRWTMPFTPYGALLASPDGSTLFVFGSKQGAPMVAAIDLATRTTLWTRVRDLTPANESISYAKLSPDSSTLFALAHQRDDAGDFSVFVMALGVENGEIAWESLTDVPGSVYAAELVVGSDRVFAVGDLWTGTEDVGIVIALEASEPLRAGEQLWSATYDSPGMSDDYWDWFADGVVSTDGETLFVTGASEFDDERFVSYPEKVLTVAYDAASGAKRWESQLSGPSPGYSWGYAISVAPAGDRIFVGGAISAETAFDRDLAIFAFGTGSGQSIWTARHGAAPLHLEQISDLAVSPDGQRVYATGSSGTQVCSSGVCTVSNEAVTLARAASTGSPLWDARFRDPDNHDGYALVRQVVLAGGTVVVGAYLRTYRQTPVAAANSFRAEPALLAYEA